MKYQRTTVLVTVMVAAGYGCGKVSAPPSEPAAAAIVEHAPSEPKTQPGALLPEGTQAGEASSTPAGAIYGEVLAAIDDISGVLEHDAPTAAELRRSTQRLDVAARNWKLYLVNAGDSAIAALEQSRLAEHAVASGDKLRENILKVARDPEKASLRPDLQNLFRALEQAMSVTERAAFQRWIKENGLQH